METGNNPSNSLIKKEYDLQPDNDQDLAETGQRSFIDISRNGVQLVKVNRKFKALCFKSFRFPRCIDDVRWSSFVETILGSDELKNSVEETEVSYSVYDSKVCLIPKGLHAKKDERTSFEFLFGESVGLNILSQELTSQESVGLFGIPREFKSVLKGEISNSFLHWSENLTDSEGTVANAVIGDDQFGLIIQKDGAFQFCNWFEVKNADDILYFLMATLESLNILHSEVKMVLWGEVEKNDPVHSTVAKFISNITFGNKPKNLAYAYSFKDLPSHRFPFIFA